MAEDERSPLLGSGAVENSPDGDMANSIDALGKRGHEQTETPVYWESRDGQQRAIGGG